MDTIRLRVQEQHCLPLKSLGTAGYQWSATVDNPQVVQVERVKQVLEVDAPMIPGRSLDEQFTMTALAIGEAIVHFTQARSFEPQAPPRAAYDVLVCVASG